MVSIERRCPFTGAFNTLEIPLTERQFNDGMLMWESGLYIQQAFPTLAPEFREFLMTGITPQKWAEIYGEDE